MLNIAICDDNIQITGQMEMMVQNIAKRNFVDADIEVFWDGKSLADMVASKVVPDSVIVAVMEKIAE